METTAHATGILNDLIEINNDRVAGFEKAIADIKDENIAYRIESKQLDAPYQTLSRHFQQVLILQAFRAFVRTSP